MSQSTRWLVGVAAAIVVAVAISIVAALAGGEERLYEAETPEGTVQRYLRAVADRDAEAARQYLSPEMLEDCPDDFLRGQLRNVGQQDFRASLLQTRQVGEGTEVRVRISERYGNAPFESDEFSHEEIFLLEQHDGRWLIEEPAWPVYGCPPKPVAVPAR